MYNIGKSLSGGTRIPNFKLVVRKSFSELKMVRTSNSLRTTVIEDKTRIY